MVSSTVLDCTAMSVREHVQWITGSEYGEARRRLISAGLPDDAPEFHELRRRVAERNDYLLERFGRPLAREHPGKWVAISMDGEVIMGDRQVEVLKLANERFGPGNASIRRLGPVPGQEVFHWCPSTRF